MHRLAFASPRVEPGKADRRERNRHGHGLTKQRCRKVDRRNIAQHPLAQRDPGQIIDVPPQRYFAIGTAVDIFEQEVRQAAARCFAKVGDIGDDHAVVSRVRRRP